MDVKHLSYIKGGTQAMENWKQDPEAKLAPRGMWMVSGEPFTMTNFIVYTVHLIGDEV
jgi:hypothetical protein